MLDKNKTSRAVDKKKLCSRVRGKVDTKKTKQNGNSQVNHTWNGLRQFDIFENVAVGLVSNDVCLYLKQVYMNENMISYNYYKKQKKAKNRDSRMYAQFIWCRQKLALKQSIQ